MLQKEAIDPVALELLKSLQADPMLDQFYLAGGSGLALHLGHRLSIDLDMFSIVPFDNGIYMEFLKDKYKFSVDFSAPNTLKGSVGSVKVDFIAHLYKPLMPVVRDEEISIYSVEDIAAMKINAIAGSGTRSKDFVDLYFLLEIFQVGNLLDFYKAKYEERNILHALKSLNYFEDVNLSDWPSIIKKKDLTWTIVKSAIDKRCKEYIKKL
jgi:hypothetical protein